MRSRARPRMFAVAALLSSCLVLACGDAAPRTEARAPASAATDALLAREGFPCRTLRVERADGTVTESCVWVADTPERSARGLQGVTDPSLGARGAMVFAPGIDSTSAFWMVDTLVPLTVVWIDSAGAVLGSADMEPCTSDPARCERYSSPAPWRSAVEIPKGEAEERGLVPGSTVSLGAPC